MKTIVSVVLLGIMVGLLGSAATGDGCSTDESRKAEVTQAMIRPVEDQPGYPKAAANNVRLQIEDLGWFEMTDHLNLKYPVSVVKMTDTFTSNSFYLFRDWESGRLNVLPAH